MGWPKKNGFCSCQILKNRFLESIMHDVCRLHTSFCHTWTLQLYIWLDQIILYCIDNQTVQVSYDPPDCRILNCHYDKKSRHKQLLSTWHLYTCHWSETIPFWLSTQDSAPSTIVAHNSYLKVIYKPMFRGHYRTSGHQDIITILSPRYSALYLQSGFSCSSSCKHMYQNAVILLNLNNIYIIRYKWTWISVLKCSNGLHQADFRSV
jgi:hypothetical protein